MIYWEGHVTTQIQSWGDTKGNRGTVYETVGLYLFKNIKVIKGKEKLRNWFTRKETKEKWELYATGDPGLDLRGDKAIEESEGNDKLWVQTVDWGQYSHFLILRTERCLCKRMSPSTRDTHTHQSTSGATYSQMVHTKNGVCARVCARLCVHWQRQRRGSKRAKPEKSMGRAVNSWWTWIKGVQELQTEIISKWQYKNY